MKGAYNIGKKFQKMKIWIAIGLAIFACLISILSFIQKPETENWAYIKIAEVYDEFTLTTELNRKLTSFENNFQYTSDSMKLEITRQEAGLKAVKNPGKNDLEMYYTLLRSLEELQTNYEDQKKLMTAEFNSHISTQLNQYIKEFGEEKGIDMIFGASGDGNIMYAKENNRNITKEVIAYINKVYEGF